MRTAIFLSSIVTAGTLGAALVSSSSSPATAPTAAGSVDRIEPEVLHFPEAAGLTAYPGRVFSGDRGCSPSSLLSYLTIEKQVVPVEESYHYALRLLQTPSSGFSVPDNVVWLDLETGTLVTGIPKLNWTQQLSVFDYTLLRPGLVDLPRYRTTLDTLAQTVEGLAAGSSQRNSRYRCATANPELDGLSDYLVSIQADVANASTIDGGLKKGIEYRVPSGCIIELDAEYLGDAVGSLIVLGNASSTQPTEDDCCKVCRGAAGCNVFVFCPSYEGCGVGDSAFPAFGCQAKRLANLTSDPTDFPAALARGPPTAFKSGRFG